MNSWQRFWILPNRMSKYHGNVWMYKSCQVTQATSFWFRVFFRLILLFFLFRGFILVSRGDTSFANCLPKIGNNVRPIFPNRHPMDETEVVAWQLSCNFHRNKHPLIQSQNHGINHGTKRSSVLLNRASSLPIMVAEPSAVHVTILQSRDP
jgi:hypothetical protein